MAWEVFTGRYKSNATALRVSLNKKQSFSFNHPVYVALGQPEQVVLMYDKDTRTIALRPATTDDLYAYPVRTQRNARSYLVAGTAFTAHCGISNDRTLAFDPFMEDGMLILEVDKAIALPPREYSTQPKWNGGRPRKSEV